jgi:molybdate transport system substrate-binding protein
MRIRIWLALCLSGSLAMVSAQTRELTVFAASDLGPALQTIVPAFEKTTAAKVTVVLGSTGNLAQQIRNGAPADVFLAASDSFIDGLVADKAVLPDSRVRYARGRIVIATPKAAAPVGSLKDLADPRIRRIAIANPAHAPYGLAAQQALQTAGVWNAVHSKLVFGENVQQAVQFVRSGAVDAGIVARALVDGPDFHWTLVDAELHAPIEQTAAVTTRSTQPALARVFLEFVNGSSGRTVLRQLGFLLPGEHF